MNKETLVRFTETFASRLLVSRSLANVLATTVSLRHNRGKAVLCGDQFEQGKASQVSFLLAIVNPISTFLALLRCLQQTESQRRMSFFLGIVLGIAFGLGLVIAFARSETSRSKRRRELVIPFPFPCCLGSICSNFYTALLFLCFCRLVIVVMLFPSSNAT